MSYTAILFEKKDNIAKITINRPEAANALNFDLAYDLMHASLECDEDPEIRAVVMTGSGRMFCAGGDLKSFSAQGEKLPAHMKEVTTYLHGAISRFARMDPPLIGAVNGTAAGAGLSIACSCDIVLAAESAKFTMAYTRVGLTPDGSSTYFLPRIVGMKRALELTITNRILSARKPQSGAWLIGSYRMQTYWLKQKSWQVSWRRGQRALLAEPNGSCIVAGRKRLKPRWKTKPSPLPHGPRPRMGEKALLHS